MNRLFILIILPIYLLGVLIMAAVPDLKDLQAPQTTFANRSAFRAKFDTTTLKESFSQPITPETEKSWIGTFWGVEICSIKDPMVKDAIQKSLTDSDKKSDRFIRSAIQTAFSLFPGEFIKEMESIAEVTPNPKNYAMAVNYILLKKPDKQDYYNRLMRKRFPDWEKTPILSTLSLHLEKPFSERLKERPPLVDLLKISLDSTKPVIFSFQRNNRNYPGLAVLRKPDGTFLRRPDGSIFAIPQLARSITNYDSYLTNGNSPQGIFSIMSIDTSDNAFIGPTPLFVTVLPCEYPVNEYFHNIKLQGVEWTKELYSDVLPASWKNYIPIYETWFAGQCGRGEIIVHGTTINPEFYAGQPYYPHTPSLGCLCAPEFWSLEDGHCLYSNQLDLIKAYSSLSSDQGYCIVVELDNRNSPVVMEDIIQDILKAESH